MADRGRPLREVRPEPGRLWVRYVPRQWPWPRRPTLDWSTARSHVRGRSPRGAESFEFPDLAGPLDDVLYVPPVAAEAREARDAWVATRVERGDAVVTHLRIGEKTVPGAIPAFDLFDELIEGEIDGFAEIETGAVVVWPLIGGLTDDDATVSRGLEGLRAAGVAAVVGMVPELDPDTKRTLAGGADGDRWERIFHGRAAEESRFHRFVAGAGLAPFPPRPVPRDLRWVGNRRAAEVLCRLADLEARLDLGEVEVQELYRAARWVDAADRDVLALAREGHLGVVPWLGGRARPVLESFAENGRAAELETLEARYLAGSGTAGTAP